MKELGDFKYVILC